MKKTNTKCIFQIVSIIHTYDTHIISTNMHSFHCFHSKCFFFCIHCIHTFSFWRPFLFVTIFPPSILFKRNHSNFRRILCAILSIILITIVYQYTLGIGTTSVFGDLILILIFSHFSFQHHRDCTWILIQCYDLSTHLVFSSLIIFFTLFCNFYS